MVREGSDLSDSDLSDSDLSGSDLSDSCGWAILSDNLRSKVGPIFS